MASVCTCPFLNYIIFVVFVVVSTPQNQIFFFYFTNNYNVLVPNVIYENNLIEKSYKVFLFMQ